MRDKHILDATCGSRTIVSPDIVADFTKMPFPDNSFELVVFDPPHLIKADGNALDVLFDADAVTADFIQEHTANADVYLAVKKILAAAPAVDAVEVKHGRWIEHPHIDYGGGYNGADYKCSICGFNDVYDIEDYNYCPKCGAKMDGDAE